MIGRVISPVILGRVVEKTTMLVHLSALSFKRNFLVMSKRFSVWLMVSGELLLAAVLIMVVMTVLSSLGAILYAGFLSHFDVFTSQLSKG
jgi:hypothetical protein